MKTVAAILMASGFSRRFGQANKLLLPIEGVPMAARTMELVCRSPLFSQRIAVAADGAVLALGEGKPLTMIRNDNPQRGMCESIRLGVLAADAAHYMFFPCDQPFLTEEVLQALVEASAPGRMVVPEREGMPSSPTIFSAAFREELLALPDGAGGRIVLRAHPQAVIRVPIEDGRALADIDTPEDARRLQT